MLPIFFEVIRGIDKLRRDSGNPWRISDMGRLFATRPIPRRTGMQAYLSFDGGNIYVDALKYVDEAHSSCSDIEFWVYVPEEK